MEIYDFFKEVVNACSSNDWLCINCPLQKIRQNIFYSSCNKKLFDYLIEIDKIVGQKIYDELVRLGINKIPNLNYCEEKKIYEKQLKVFEKYCKNNSLEIE